MIKVVCLAKHQSTIQNLHPLCHPTRRYGRGFCWFLQATAAISHGGYWWLLRYPVVELHVTIGPKPYTYADKALLFSIPATVRTDNGPPQANFAKLRYLGFKHCRITLSTPRGTSSGTAKPLKASSIPRSILKQSWIPSWNHRHTACPNTRSPFETMFSKTPLPTSLSWHARWHRKLAFMTVGKGQDEKIPWQKGSEPNTRVGGHVLLKRKKRKMDMLTNESTRKRAKALTITASKRTGQSPNIVTKDTDTEPFNHSLEENENRQTTTNKLRTSGAPQAARRDPQYLRWFCY